MELEKPMYKPLHNYDPVILSGYLEQHVSGFTGLASLEKFSDGQSNPTYKILDTSGASYVLRAKPPGKLLKSAHAVDREFKVMTALAKTAVPVPKMLHLSGDDSPMGAQFLVMDYLSGTVFWDPALPECPKSFRTEAYSALVKTLAALHEVDPHKVGLEDFGRPGNYFGRQVSRWTRQYHASETQSRPDMDWTIDWLSQNLWQMMGRYLSCMEIIAWTMSCLTLSVPQWLRFWIGNCRHWAILLRIWPINVWVFGCLKSR